MFLHGHSCLYKIRNTQQQSFLQAKHSLSAACKVVLIGGLADLSLQTKAAVSLEEPLFSLRNLRLYFPLIQFKL